jgi:ATPase subunit of ABC transporter with duplicated ATPase domains
VAFGHSDAISIFSDVDLDLRGGFTGLVGENGAGKTTLLGLLSGAIRPDSGEIVRDPPDATIASCAQVVERVTEDVEALARASDGIARRILGELALDPAELERFATLSPGERQRWQIGAALHREPDVLLLDEPTNHLDADARGLLVAALRRFRGVGVVVSHDRALLEALTTQTIRVHAGTARLYEGAYGAARRTWEADARALREEHAERRAEARAVARRLDATRREHAAATANRSTARRMRDKNDHDARGLLADFRASSAEKRLGREVQVVRDRLARAEARAGEIRVERERGAAVFAGYERAPKPLLASVRAEEILAGSRVVLRDVALDLGRDARVWIEGPNGAGKSTLVRALLAEARLPPERLVLVPQELDDAAVAAMLGELRGLAPSARGRVLAVLDALGSDPARLLASARPSPGEARKLLVALGLGRHAWALVLDEPTNHLDLPSIERLEGALSDFPGALLLVTHDAAFARPVARDVWRVRDGQVVVETLAT